MDEGSQTKADTNEKWPSVDEVKPVEEGGPTARIGFGYQDAIAVSLLIDMLEDPSVLKVHCETHDDSVVVRQGMSPEHRTAEFVQVKGGAPDKLWSVPDICRRKDGKPGTSIFETSLGRDKHEEISRFKIVTLRPTVSALKPLTYPIGSPGRDINNEEMKALSAELKERFPAIASKKKNGPIYWLSNCLWCERHDEQAIDRDNLIRLIRLSVKEGRGLLLDSAEVLLLVNRTWLVP